MKHILTYLVLYSYSILMFKPVWPVLFDKMAHLCWEYEHLQVVHQHNGIYHVDQELRDVAGKTEKENTNGTYKFEASEYTHIIYSTTCDFSIIVFTKKQYASSLIYPYNAHLETDYPPPKS